MFCAELCKNLLKSVILFCRNLQVIYYVIRSIISERNVSFTCMKHLEINDIYRNKLKQCLHTFLFLVLFLGFEKMSVLVKNSRTLTKKVIVFFKFINLIIPFKLKRDNFICSKDCSKSSNLESSKSKIKSSNEHWHNVRI